ncbi:MAG: DNA polymerase III subunit delta [Candidatus Rokubacteria bacterium]|nr:DNA polymerase III subunit delta [Candidatus Rokubacteria bacterium]
MDFAAFLRTAERGQLPPVVLVHGPDVQLLDDALRIVTAALFPDPTLATLGREALDGNEATGDEIARTAQTMPLMTAMRLVAVRHAEELKDAPALREYVARPNPSTCLLLLVEEARDPRERKRHWLLDVVPSAGVVTLVSRKDHGLVDWLRQRAAAEELDVSKEAAELLVEWVGDDTAALLNETRKAALSGGGAQRTVGKNEVLAVVGEQRIAHVFDLTRAIDHHETGQALRMLEGLMTSEEPMRLLSLLVGEVRLTWTIAELERAGHRPDQIARAVRRPHDVVSRKLAAAASPRLLAEKLRRCWDVERRLKSGGEPHAELAALVGELCR